MRVHSMADTAVRNSCRGGGGGVESSNKRIHFMADIVCCKE